MQSDNLKIYHNNIKMIYIDPPYNTQRDKSYFDKYNAQQWKSFIKERLVSSKKFLTEDGVVFISIDDNEQANLKIICEEVFGKDNFIGMFITKQSQRSNSKHINTVHEYILCFSKNKKNVKPFKISRLSITKDKSIILKLSKKVDEIIKIQGYEVAIKEINSIISQICKKNNISWLKNYNHIDKNGNIFFPMDLSTPNKPRDVSIPEINLKLNALNKRGWVSDKKFINLYNNDRLFFRDGRPYEKKYLVESFDNVPSILNFFSRQGTNNLKKLGLDEIFDTPKPVELIKFLILISTNVNDNILDFFAGSGTTAQAVYEVNSENNRNNKYLLIQKKEDISSNSNLYKTCKKHNIQPDISEILKYRINRYLELNNKEQDYILTTYE